MKIVTYFFIWKYMINGLLLQVYDLKHLYKLQCSLLKFINFLRLYRLELHPRNKAAASLWPPDVTGASRDLSYFRR